MDDIAPSVALRDSQFKADDVVVGDHNQIIKHASVDSGKTIAATSSAIGAGSLLTYLCMKPAATVSTGALVVLFALAAGHCVANRDGGEEPDVRELRGIRLPDELPDSTGPRHVVLAVREPEPPTPSPPPVPIPADPPKRRYAKKSRPKSPLACDPISTTPESKTQDLISPSPFR